MNESTVNEIFEFSVSKYLRMDSEFAAQYQEAV